MIDFHFFGGKNFLSMQKSEAMKYNVAYQSLIRMSVINVLDNELDNPALDNHVNYKSTSLSRLARVGAGSTCVGYMGILVRNPK